MCNPVIQQGGYDEGLELYCEEHKTYEDVKREDGRHAHTIDLQKFLDVVVAHRAKFEKKE